MKKFAKHTTSFQVIDGIPITIPNKVGEVDTGSEHWHISYCSSNECYGCPTTALVLGHSEFFIILKGDHREGFQKVIDDKGRLPKTRLEACLAYCKENRKAIHDRFSTEFISLIETK